MEGRLDQLTNDQIVNELKKHFTAAELDEAKEEIDGFIAEQHTLPGLVEKVRTFLTQQYGGHIK